MSQIPVDFDELVQNYGHVIVSAGVPESQVLLVACRLCRERDVLKFRPPLPDTVTGTELLAYLGITFNAWDSYVDKCRPNAKRSKQIKDPKRYMELCPQPLEGGSARGGPFRMSEVQRLFKARREIFSKFKTVEEAQALGGKHPIFEDSVLPGGKPSTFEAHLLRETQALIKVPNYENQFVLPENLPQDENELHKKYERLVYNQVYQRIKYGINVQDAVNEVWLRITSSNLLRKFIQKGSERLPITMSTNEAKDYLGITDGAWDRMQKTYKGAPVPVKGSCRNPDARFKTEDIVALDNSGFFKRRPCQRRLPPDSVTEGQLIGYIRITIHNTLRNLFRTMDRHCNKEQVLGNVVLSEAGDSFRYSPSVLEEPLAWEDTLVSHDPSAEELCDAHRAAYRVARKLNVEVDSPEYQVALLKREKTERDKAKSHFVEQLASTLGIEAGSPEYYTAVKTVLQRVSEEGLDLESATAEEALQMVSSVMKIRCAAVG